MVRLCKGKKYEHGIEGDKKHCMSQLVETLSEENQGKRIK